MKQLKTRIQKTRAYQIFIVRAMKRRYTKLMYAVIIYSLLLGHLYLTRTWFPPQSFDQLEIIEETLVSLKKPPRESLYRMVIRQNDDSKTSLRVYLDKKEKDSLTNIIGGNLEVHYDYDLHPFLYKFKMARNIKQSKSIIVNYDNHERLKKNYVRDKKRIYCFILIPVVLLSYTYIVNRKKNLGAQGNNVS